MNPEEQKEEFRQPGETQYFSASSDTTPLLSEEQAPPSSVESSAQVDTPEGVVTWEAPEYIHQQKGVFWFFGLGLAVLTLILLDVFLIQSFLFSFSLLTLVMAAALIVHSYRPADLVHYVLSDKGLYINDTLHGFAEFKGFGVLHEGAEFLVELIPVRRFRPSLSVYFPEENGETIVDLLGVRLPMQQLKPDLLDKITRSLGL